jgi:REP-associated tyrosine transposase
MVLHRKTTCLSPEQYFGHQIYFITICCDHRRAHLADAKNAEFVLRLLLECAANCSFRLHAYCIMPDHIHFLAEGLHQDSDLREFVRIFKQRSAFEFRKLQGQCLWEMSYYDYILRPSDAIEEVASYIWWNPVRRQLCTEPREFPFSGSQTIARMYRSLLGAAWTAPWKIKEPA